ncbi:MAG: Rab family GTPase [Candidatus Hodarchaeales archaeon]|jgi:small GTP-binding protein
MGSRLRSFDEDKKFKVVIIGDSSIGKTSLLERYISKRFNENPKPTIGAEISKQNEIITIKATPEKKDPGRHHNRQFEYWDLGGHKLFEQIRTSYLRGADGILLCFSLNDSRSIVSDDLADINNHSIDRSLKEMSVALLEEVKEVPILLLGTKKDLEIKITSQEIRKEIKKLRKEGLNVLSFEESPDGELAVFGKYHLKFNRTWEAEKWRTGNGCIFTSSKTGYNVSLSFEIMKQALFEQSTLIIEDRVHNIDDKLFSKRSEDLTETTRKKKREFERVW